MQRHSLRIVLWMVACFLLAGSTAWAQEVTTRRIGHNLHLLTTTNDFGVSMNNLISSGPDGVLLVDTTSSGLYSAFRAGVDQISIEPVRILINTHWHHDHTGLNADFVRNEGTDTIIAHRNVPPYLSAEQYLADLDVTFPALPPEAQPTDLVQHIRLLDQNGEGILILTAPPKTHSNSDLLLFFLKSNLAYLGDVYFGGSYPFIDRSSGGSLGGMIRTCKLVLPLINSHTVIVPSHGVVGDRFALLSYIEMLETVRSRIQALIGRGLTEQEVLTAQPLVDLNPVWGAGFVSGDAFTAIVYRDLSTIASQR